jgi:hypothetical protein
MGSLLSLLPLRLSKRMLWTLPGQAIRVGFHASVDCIELDVWRLGQSIVLPYILPHYSPSSIRNFKSPQGCYYSLVT